MLKERSIRDLLLAAAVVCFAAVPFWAQQTSSITEASTCETVSLSGPGFGVSYKGTVRNSDYRFSAVIPEGMTAWGAGDGAPFHGFRIYLNDKGGRASCIMFDVAHVFPDVDQPPVHKHLNEGTRIKVGGKTAFETVAKGSNHGVRFDEIEVTLELPRDGYANGVGVTLITPSQDRNKTEPVFRQFLSQLKFW